MSEKEIEKKQKRGPQDKKGLRRERNNGLQKKRKGIEGCRERKIDKATENHRNRKNKQKTKRGKEGKAERS